MTTETLEDYLAGDYHQDMDDIREVEETLERTANVFLYAQGDNGAWPYSLKQRKPAASDPDVSQGTQAMILAALTRLSDRGRLPSGRRARTKVSSEDLLCKAIDTGAAALMRSLSGGLRSRSFGLNDPVTLSHLLDLWRAQGAKPNDPLLILLDGPLKQLMELGRRDPLSLDAPIEPAQNQEPPHQKDASLLPELPEVRSTFRDEKPADIEGHPPEYLDNAFVPLRIVRSLTSYEEAGNSHSIPAFRKSYRRFFETRLHEQLSYSEIPDSRFDPAEMIFCLEGLILTAPNAVDDRLFERVLKVLEIKQEESAHWRPSRPIYATQQGMTMLPVSVEGAVSLMRAITIKDQHKNFQPLSSRAIPMARRFWRWLRARSVRFTAEPWRSEAAANVKDRSKYAVLTGWHSEHVNDPELIHLWDTSQVIEFMLAYRELLQRSIGGRTLLLSRLKIDLPARGLRRDWSDRWQETVDQFEPWPGMTSPSKVYEDLTTDFIQPWASGDPQNFSILLYGPPGTGKSTLAENVARALGMRMVTVTVSDFLGRGGEHVESRAKAIFQTLEAQIDTVILFDEIDAFLLDRDSNRYAKQDTLFQFLTPGMLTKINDLRRLQRSIFIVATNYENRIDPAIKRRGRIDKRYLLQLPNAYRRALAVAGLLNIKDVSNLPPEVARETLFFGFPDIKSAVQNSGRGATPGAVAVEAWAQGRPKTFESYLRRIKRSRKGDIWEDFHWEEFRGLFYLWKEVFGDEAIEKMMTEYEGLIPKRARQKLTESLAGNSDG